MKVHPVEKLGFKTATVRARLAESIVLSRAHSYLGRAAGRDLIIAVDTWSN